MFDYSQKYVCIARKSKTWDVFVNTVNKLKFNPH